MKPKKRFCQSRTPNRYKKLPKYLFSLLFVFLSFCLVICSPKKHLNCAFGTFFDFSSFYNMYNCLK